MSDQDAGDSGPDVEVVDKGNDYAKADEPMDQGWAETKTPSPQLEDGELQEDSLGLYPRTDESVHKTEKRKEEKEQLIVGSSYGAAHSL